MSEGIKSIARQIQSQGRGRDTILAHIMPEEAALLKRLGGRGSVNPKTGLLEFGVDGGPEAGSTGSASGNSYGGSSSVSPGLSGFGGGSSSPGGVDSSGRTNPTVGGGGGGGAIIGGGGGSGGGGMLTASRPSMTTAGGGGSFVPGGMDAGATFGMPTLLSNAWSAVKSAIPGMTSAPGYVPTGWAGSILGGISSGLEALQTGNPQISTPPSLGTPTGITFDTNPVFTNRPSTASILATPSPTGVPAAPTSTTNAYNFVPNNTGTLLDAENLQNQQLQVNAAQTISDAFGLTKETPFPDVPNAADLYETSGLTPSGILAPQPTEISPAQIAGGSGAYMSQVQSVPQMDVLRSEIDRLNAGLVDPSQVAGGSGNYMTQVPAYTPTVQAPTPAPSFGVPTIMAPTTLGAGLENVMGTVPAGVYTFPQTVPGMSFRQATPTVSIGEKDVASAFRVNVPSFLDTVKQTTLGAGLLGTPSLYGRVVSALPEQGIQFTPGAVDPATGIPKTGTAIYTGAGLGPDATADEVAAAQQKYEDFITKYGGALTPRTSTVGTFTGGEGTGPAFDVSGYGDVQPTSISDLGLFTGMAEAPSSPQEVGAVVSNSLEDTFAMLSGQRPAMTMPNVATTTPSMIDYNQALMNAPTTVGTTPLYAEATPFSGPKGGTVPMSDAARWAGGGVFSNIESLNGLPPGYLGKLYGIESSFGKNLASKVSSATGPFGFISSTGKAYGLIDETGDYRNDIVQSAAAAGALAADNSAVLERFLGRPPTAGELYLAHQQGPAGAVSLLSNPNESAFNALKRALGSEKLAMQALVNNGGSLTMTAAEFANKWTSKMDRAPVSPTGGYTQYANYTPTISPAIVAQQPQQTGKYLDEEFMRVVNEIGGGQADLPQENAVDANQNVFDKGTPVYAGGGGGGATRQTPSGIREILPEFPGADAPAPTPPTTGMNLTRQAYVPKTFVTTTSPAYS